MELALILICAALILLWLLEKRKRAQEQKEEASNVEQYKGRFQKTFLMTLNEKSEYWKLKEVTDRLGLLLFAKVRMLAIVTPKEKKPVYLNKVIRKHLDFVILNKKGYTVCVIELDDNSHQAQSRQKSDRLKEFLLSDVGIPLIRRHGIVPEEMERLLTEYSNGLPG